MKYIIAYFFSVFLITLSYPSEKEIAFLYQNGKYDRLTKILEKSIVQDPLDFKNYINLALIYKERGEYRKGINILARLNEFLHNKDALQIQAELYFLNGQYRKALKIFKEVAEQDSKNWIVLAYLGLVYESLGDNVLSADYYRRSLSVEENTIALYRLGKMAYRQNDFKKAVNYFLRLYRLDPSFRVIYFYLGKSFSRLGEYEEAYRFLSKAFKFYPSSKEIKKELLLSKNELGKKYFTDYAAKLQKRRERIELAPYQSTKSPYSLRIGIVRKAKRIRFKCGGEFSMLVNNKVIKGEKGVFYDVSWQAGKVVVSRNSKIIISTKEPIRFKGERYPFYILDVNYGRENFWGKRMDTVLRGNLEIIPNVEGVTLVNIIDIEEYLYGVLPAEMPIYYNYEALKAQAVIARTFALKNRGRHRKEGFDLCAQAHCQVYRGLNAESKVYLDAVNDTKGEVLVYDGKLVDTFYHANCGGCVGGDLFGEKPYYFVNKRDDPSGDELVFTPYFLWRWLREDKDSFCRYSRDYRWQRVYDRDDLLLGMPWGEVEMIQVLQRKACAHINKIRIIFLNQKEKILSGDLKIRNYFDHLRSTVFTVDMGYPKSRKDKRRVKLIIIWGAGFGHGVGLCQKGANVMGEEGYNYKQILKQYYKDIEIKKIY